MRKHWVQLSLGCKEDTCKFGKSGCYTCKEEFSSNRNKWEGKERKRKRERKRNWKKLKNWEKKENEIMIIKKITKSNKRIWNVSKLN